MGTRTILVIEDDKLNMKLMRAILGIGKYRIMEAVDAETGLNLAREHSPDLILMDIQLPGRDGLSAARIIKRDPALKEIPVIALTSYAMEHDEEKAMQAGCAGYITKPINTRTFLDTMERFFKHEDIDDS